VTRYISAGEGSLPEAIAEYGNIMLTGRAVISWIDQPSESRLHAENRKVVAAYQLPSDSFGGVSPGRFRSGFAIDPIEGQYPMTVPTAKTASVVRLPELATLPAFHVAGPARRFDEATKSEIPQLWSALIGALPFDGQVKSWATYGVVSSVDPGDGCFQYLAGVGVEPGCVPPPGFSTMEIPAATYAVFRITLDGSALHPQVKQAMAVVWGELLPASGLKLADRPDFELYDGRFDPLKAGAVIDLHVPVQA